MEENDRLKLARENAGYDTASEAARRFGWAVPTYLAHENSARGLRPKVAAKYAKAFNVSVAWLLYEEGEPNFKNARQRPIMSSKIEYDRANLLEVIEASFQCLEEIDRDDARAFAEVVLELAERRQAAPSTRHPADLVRNLALSASRIFSRRGSR